MGHEFTDITIRRKGHLDIVLAHLIALGLFSNGRHRLNGLNGIFARSRLARKHKGISAVVDGVGNIGHLSTCRTGILNHRVQHLSGHNDRFLLLHALADNLALDTRNTLNGNLDTKIATGYHDAIRSIYNLVDIVDTLLILYL